MKKRLLPIIICIIVMAVSCACFTGCDPETSQTIDEILDILDELTASEAPGNTKAPENTKAPSNTEVSTATPTAKPTSDPSSSVLSQIPAYSGNPWVVLNNNKPLFTEKEITDVAFEYYSELDNLGRCGYAMACVGVEIMPTENRGDISSVRPTGWHSVKYDFVDGGSLYNRCHLIAFKLSGENANATNLITGTRYLNNTAMTLFEEKVYDYVKDSDRHVMYRVTPVFDGNNLLASGVIIEGYSVEDKGASICFNVYCYNVEPGVDLDYKTGDSKESSKKPNYGKKSYVVNLTSYKFHLPTCDSVASMYDSNKLEISIDMNMLTEMGCKPCGSCIG